MILRFAMEIPIQCLGLPNSLLLHDVRTGGGKLAYSTRDEDDRGRQISQRMRFRRVKKRLKRLKRLEELVQWQMKTYSLCAKM